MKIRMIRKISVFALFFYCFSSGLFAQTAPVPGPSPAQTRLMEDITRLLAEKKGQRSIAGIDSWYFLSAELEHLSKGSFIADPPLKSGENPLSAILDFQAQLLEKGIVLIFLPVPAKATLYPEKLGTGFSPPSSRLDYGSSYFYSLLRKNDVELIDLMDIYLKERKMGLELYCKSDAHWSPQGALLAAKEVARKIKTFNWYSSVPRVNFIVSNETLLFSGDLLPRGGDQPDESQPARIVKMPDGTFIKPDSNSPVLLIGDSHTLVFYEGGTMLAQGAGLFDQLAAELGFAPDLIGIRGSGATASRVSLMRKNRQDPSWLAKKKIIIWCLSEREFSAPASNWKLVPIAPKS